MGGGTQLVWLTCPPIAVEVTGGVVVEGMEGMVRGMRFNVMEANLMVATETAAAGYDVLDLHYHLMHQVCGMWEYAVLTKIEVLNPYILQVHKRMPDGLHWTQAAVRLQVIVCAVHCSF